MKLDRRQFLHSGATLMASRMLPWTVLRGHPHVALHIYTRPLFRQRHAAIVQQALEQRAVAHSSGWENRNGKPVLAVGPVGRNAGYWHGQRLGKRISRTWPFVAVLEYEGTGKPRAFIDWFRRTRGSRSDDAWHLDPNRDYVNHINEEMVTSQDDRWNYIAVPDTPTGTYVGTAEFAIRARVSWADGRRAQLGWWVWFDAPRGARVTDWQVEQTPLVDWRVSESKAKLGAVETAAVADPDRELAVWGTSTVFRFPPMLPGLTPGLGRK